MIRVLVLVEVEEEQLAVEDGGADDSVELVALFLLLNGVAQRVGEDFSQIDLVVGL